MRFVRLSAAVVAAALLLVFATAAVAVAAPHSTKAQTYKVLVGAEQARRGVSLMGYYPSHIKIHVGDTVRWIQNSNEIHTVTFLGGQPLPELIVPAASLNLPADPQSPGLQSAGHHSLEGAGEHRRPDDLGQLRHHGT